MRWTLRLEGGVSFENSDRWNPDSLTRPGTNIEGLVSPFLDKPAEQCWLATINSPDT